MEEQLQNPDGFEFGDKIRIRFGPFAGARGIIRSEKEGKLEISLNESGIVSVSIEDVTNYSLAARRAWKTMPKRAGRPRLPDPRKKMVSLRLDIDVWDRLEEAVDLGLILNKEKVINSWLRQELDVLFDEGNPTE